MKRPVRHLVWLTLSLLAATAVGFAENLSGDRIVLDFSHYSGVNPRRLERYECRLDTDKLSKGDAAALRLLVNRSGVLAARDSEFEMLDGGPSDHLKITVGTFERKLDWSPGHAPVTVLPLVQYLMARATKRSYVNGVEQPPG